MEKEVYEQMFRNQEKYWFSRAKGYFFDALCGAFARGKRKLKVCDIGCGTGALFGYLSSFGDVFGTDVSMDAISFAGQTRGKALLVLAGGERLVFKDSVFDMLCLSDVLYHKAVLDEVAFLRECFRVLMPGGRLMLSVPAYNILRGGHDVATYGARRYRRYEINRILLASGFIIRRISYAYMVLFPFVAVMRFLSGKFGESKSKAEHAFLPGFMSAVLESVLFAESRLLSVFDLPFGLSVMAVAEKPA